MLEYPEQLGGIGRAAAAVHASPTLVLILTHPRPPTGADLDVEAATAPADGLLSHAGWLDHRRGCWDGSWGEGAAFARRCAAMAAPCGRRLKTTSLSGRDEATYFITLRRGGDGMRQGGQASAIRVRSCRSSGLGTRAKPPSDPRGACVTSLSVLREPGAWRCELRRE